jgi:OOP family OmpA-OmpF porin
MGYVQWVTGPVVFVHHRARRPRRRPHRRMSYAPLPCARCRPGTRAVYPHGVGADGTLSFGAMANYSYRPFTIFNADCPNSENNDGCSLGAVRARPLEHLATLDLMATVTLGRRLQIGLTLPVSYETGQAINPATAYPLGGEETQSGFALGDPRLDVKVRLTRPGLTGVGAALGAFATLPTGQHTGSARYVADSTVALGGRGIVDVREGRFFAAANLGFVWRPDALTLFSTKVGTQLLWGAGAGVVATPRVSFLAEVFGSSDLSSAQQSNGVEADLAARYTLGDLSFTLGGGAGLVRAVGTPVARAFLGATWAPVRVDADSDGVDDSVDRCVGEAEDRDGYDDLDGCPDADNDGDGMADDADRCPDQPEDRDNFQDSDGCPDLDNDNDGIPDGYDSCPREPEDRDGDHDEDGCPDNDRDHDGVSDENDRCPGEAEDMDGAQDEDGCPDPDNDNDGVLDVNDQCSDQPETRNGFQDEDGCPDSTPDRDSDGIPDDRDRCPGEPETFNGLQDEDGCPEGAPALASVTDGQIRITEPVNFMLSSDQIVGGQSFRVLDTVVSLLNAHPEIRGVEIQGHTDDRGNPIANRALSQRRANAVKVYLVAHGVSAERLFTVGHGPDRPVEEARTLAARARNRRVEFHIVPSGPAAPAPATPAPATP